MSIVRAYCTVHRYAYGKKYARRYDVIEMISSDVEGDQRDRRPKRRKDSLTHPCEVTPRR
jgi:hypothetical protein